MHKELQSRRSSQPLLTRYLPTSGSSSSLIGLYELSVETEREEGEGGQGEQLETLSTPSKNVSSIPMYRRTSSQSSAEQGQGKRAGEGKGSGAFHARERVSPTSSSRRASAQNGSAGTSVKKAEGLGIEGVVPGTKQRRGVLDPIPITSTTTTRTPRLSTTSFPRRPSSDFPARPVLSPSPNPRPSPRPRAQTSNFSQTSLRATQRSASVSALSALSSPTFHSQKKRPLVRPRSFSTSAGRAKDDGPVPPWLENGAAPMVYRDEATGELAMTGRPDNLVLPGPSSPLSLPIFSTNESEVM